LGPPAEQLAPEQAGKPGASTRRGRAADDLHGSKTLAELDREAQISALPPVVLGGLVVVPLGLVAAMTGRSLAVPAHPADTQASAARARAVVMEVERALGFEPTDRELEKLGYDIESRVVSGPDKGRLRFIEVKGRVTGADTVTVTKNEILTSLNKPDDFILALVEFLDGDTHRVHYLRRPFQREPDFGVTSVNYDFADLLVAESPHDQKKNSSAALPLDAINGFALEKGKLFFGHPRNLQQWWSRKNLGDSTCSDLRADG
jgi:hypothetical protein